MYRCCLHGGNSQRSPVMKTTKNSPRRCMPPLRFLRHATRQRGWTITVHSHWHIPLSESIDSCCQGHEVWLAGYMSTPVVPYPCLCKGPATLGRGGATPSPQPTLSFGREHARALAGNGPTHYFCRGGCLHHHGAIQLDGDNLTLVNEGCPTRIPEESFPQQQSLPEGIPICDLQQRAAYHHCHAGYHRGRGTNHSTLGVYANPVHVQPQAPMPSAWVHRDHTSPVGGRTCGK